MKKISDFIKTKLQDRINKRNRRKLHNKEFTLIASNCTGGFIYHWLGCKFNSPFINLYLSPIDFITALENWEEFLAANILEIKNKKPYPLGKVVIKDVGEILIHFMHYNTFEEAIEKWEIRKARMEKNTDKIGFMLSNWQNDDSLLERFDQLPFPNKVAFSNHSCPTLKSVYYLKGLEEVLGEKNIYLTYKINGKRYIDQFDYVDFINGLK